MSSEVELVFEEVDERVEINPFAVLFEDLVESLPVVDVDYDVFHPIDEQGQGFLSSPRLVGVESGVHGDVANSSVVEFFCHVIGSEGFADKMAPAMPSEVLPELIDGMKADSEKIFLVKHVFRIVNLLLGQGDVGKSFINGLEGYGFCLVEHV